MIKKEMFLVAILLLLFCLVMRLPPVSAEGGPWALTPSCNIEFKGDVIEKVDCKNNILGQDEWESLVKTFNFSYQQGFSDGMEKAKERRVSISDIDKNRCTGWQNCGEKISPKTCGSSGSESKCADQ